MLGIIQRSKKVRGGSQKSCSLCNGLSSLSCCLQRAETSEESLVREKKNTNTEHWLTLWFARVKCLIQHKCELISKKSQRFHPKIYMQNQSSYVNLYSLPFHLFIVHPPKLSSHVSLFQKSQKCNKRQGTLCLVISTGGWASEGDELGTPWTNAQVLGDESLLPWQHNSGTVLLDSWVRKIITLHAGRVTVCLQKCQNQVRRLSTPSCSWHLYFTIFHFVKDFF